MRLYTASAIAITVGVLAGLFVLALAQDFQARTYCASGYHTDPCPWLTAPMVYCDEPMAGNPCAPAEWRCSIAWGNSCP